MKNIDLKKIAEKLNIELTEEQYLGIIVKMNNCNINEKSDDLIHKFVTDLCSELNIKQLLIYHLIAIMEMETLHKLAVVVKDNNGVDYPLIEKLFDTQDYENLEPMIVDIKTKLNEFNNDVNQIELVVFGYNIYKDYMFEYVLESTIITPLIY